VTVTWDWDCDVGDWGLGAGGWQGPVELGPSSLLTLEGEAMGLELEPPVAASWNLEPGYSGVLKGGMAQEGWGPQDLELGDRKEGSLQLGKGYEGGRD